MRDRIAQRLFALMCWIEGQALGSTRRKEHSLLPFYLPPSITSLRITLLPLPLVLALRLCAQTDDGLVLLARTYKDNMFRNEPTKEMVARLKNDVPAEIDLLSIDIDGNDYWVWQAMNATSPRVVVIEYNASMGAERSISTQYDPAFDRWKKHDSGYYHGASLASRPVTIPSRSGQPSPRRA